MFSMCDAYLASLRIEFEVHSTNQKQFDKEINALKVFILIGMDTKNLKRSLINQHGTFYFYQ